MPYDYKNKTKNINNLNDYMLAKTLSMFEYYELPDTIPARELEMQLQKNGYSFITKVGNELYAFTGGLGGESDAYGNPTTITIANTFLKFNATLDINKDGVLISNDDMRLGLLKYYEKQNTLLVENDINMVVWGFNSRTVKTISAPDDKTRESANQYLNKIINGEVSVIGDNPFFDGVKVQGSAQSGAVTIQSMIEYQQFLQAKMYNEVGLAANFNMKRERLISSELDQAEDSLFPLVYNMMSNRISAIEKINKMFGLNINVDFGSVWALKNKKLVDGVPDNQNQPGETTEQNQPGEGQEEGEQGQAPATVPDTYTENDVSNNEDVNNTDDNNADSSDENNSDDGEKVDPQIAELKAIINSDESSDEDKKAAQDLLDDMEANHD